MVPGNLPSQANAKGGKFGLSMRLEGGLDIISTLCLNIAHDQMSLMVAAVKLLDASCDGSDNNVRIVLKKMCCSCCHCFFKITSCFSICLPTSFKISSYSLRSFWCKSI